MLQTNKNEQYV